SDLVLRGRLGDPEVVAGLLDERVDRYGAVKGLVYLPALGGRAVELTGLFLLARGLRTRLEDAAEAGGAVVLGATAMGGAFGVDGSVANAEHGAITGFLKSLAQEWPTVRVKAVDLGPVDAVEAAGALLTELDAADGIVEIGYLEARPLDGEGEPVVTADSVVLVTGGARGITAEAAVALAREHRPTLVLVGRT